VKQVQLVQPGQLGPLVILVKLVLQAIPAHQASLVRLAEVVIRESLVPAPAILGLAVREVRPAMEVLAASWAQLGLMVMTVQVALVALEAKPVLVEMLGNQGSLEPRAKQGSQDRVAMAAS
jgi:hypothetical protein